MKKLAFASLLVLAGCASQYPVMRTGDNSFQATAWASPARGGASGATTLALESANKQCESLGKMITVLDQQTAYVFPANTSATVTFKCS